jgi:hypothetical protein
VKAPGPSQLRLVSNARAASAAPKPPLGLRVWSPQASGAAIVLDPGKERPENGELDDVVATLAQIPEASTLPPGTPVVVFGEAADHRPLWRKLLAARPTRVSRAARCGALIAQGYVDVGAGIDEETGADLAWGKSPS